MIFKTSLLLIWFISFFFCHIPTRPARSFNCLDNAIRCSSVSTCERVLFILSFHMCAHLCLASAFSPIYISLLHYNTLSFVFLFPSFVSCFVLVSAQWVAFVLLHTIHFSIDSLVVSDILSFLLLDWLLFLHFLFLSRSRTRSFSLFLCQFVSVCRFKRFKNAFQTKRNMLSKKRTHQKYREIINFFSLRKNALTLIKR